MSRSEVSEENWITSHLFSSLSLISKASIAEYAPPGFFAATPVVPAYKIRERVFGIDVDRHVNEVSRAYAYASQTSIGIVKDGLSDDNMQASSINEVWLASGLFVSKSDPIMLQVSSSTVDDTAHVQSFGASDTPLSHRLYFCYSASTPCESQVATGVQVAGMIRFYRDSAALLWKKP
jgi:hypothetical protein